MSTDSAWYVRSAVAYNINTPVSILKQLSTDSDCDVRRAVARNINTPVSILKQMKNKVIR